MVQTVEAVKGSGGSISIGTTGTISSLMTRELESIKSTPKAPPISVAHGKTSAKRLQPRKALYEASTSSSSSSSSSSSKNINQRSPEITRKTKGYNKSTHRIPMLGSDNIVLDRTPNWQKTDRKGPNIVEIVDIKCGHPDRAWPNPLTNKLKKLRFSKLSESII